MLEDHELNEGDELVLVLESQESETSSRVFEKQGTQENHFLQNSLVIFVGKHHSMHFCNLTR